MQKIIQFPVRKRFKELKWWFTSPFDFEVDEEEMYLEDVLQFIASGESEFIPSETQNFRITGDAEDEEGIITDRVKRLYRIPDNPEDIYAETEAETFIITADNCVDVMFCEEFNRCLDPFLDDLY